MQVVRINRAELRSGLTGRLNNQCCPIGHFAEQVDGCNFSETNAMYRHFKRKTNKDDEKFYDTFDCLFDEDKAAAEEFAVKYMEDTNYMFEFYGEYKC